MAHRIMHRRNAVRPFGFKRRTLYFNIEEIGFTEGAQRMMDVEESVQKARYTSMHLLLVESINMSCEVCRVDKRHNNNLYLHTFVNCRS